MRKTIVQAGSEADLNKSYLMIWKPIKNCLKFRIANHLMRLVCDTVEIQYIEKTLVLTQLGRGN